MHCVIQEMSQNNIAEYLVSSGEETDTADESFVFTRKRKVNSFFIDFSDGESESKKSKIDVNGNCTASKKSADECQ